MLGEILILNEEMKVIKRIVDTDFWTDSKVVEQFSPEDKLFFLYLMTNPHTTQLGIYSVSRKVMSFEIGYSLDAINVLLDRFENKYKIIRTCKETNEIAILNYLKYSIMKGGKPVFDLLVKEVKAVKEKSLLQAVFKKLEGYKNLNKTVQGLITYINDTTMLSDVNDNDNDNDNDVSYPVSYHDSYYDSLENHEPEAVSIDTNTAAYNGVKAHDAIKYFIEKFNGIDGLVKYRKPSINDELAIDRILREFSQEEIEETFDKLAKSDFLRGANDIGWKATFDWIIKLDNFKKVFNGNYDNAKGRKGSKGRNVPTDLSGQYAGFKADEVEF